MEAPSFRHIISSPVTLLIAPQPVVIARKSKT